LDDDVAALLSRVRKTRKSSLKEVVNAALREGLVKMTTPVSPRKRFRTQTVSLGRCYLPSLDDVSEVLAATEGERFK
jgi:hypothetical protein